MKIKEWNGKTKKKTKYDPEKIMTELLKAVTESYLETKELKRTAEEFFMSTIKIRKLLIKDGVYNSEQSAPLEGQDARENPDDHRA